MEVTSGLKDGDQVIVSGLQKIGDGAPVNATPQVAAPVTAGAKAEAGGAAP
ncbi:hypothetical protein D3C83_223550 [compost metagenome]